MYWLFGFLLGSRRPSSTATSKANSVLTDSYRSSGLLTGSLIRTELRKVNGGSILTADRLMIGALPCASPTGSPSSLSYTNRTVVFAAELSAAKKENLPDDRRSNCWPWGEFSHLKHINRFDTLKDHQSLVDSPSVFERPHSLARSKATITNESSAPNWCGTFDVWTLLMQWSRLTLG